MCRPILLQLPPNNPHTPCIPKVCCILKLTGRDFPLSIFGADFCNKIAWTYVVCVAITVAKSLTNNNIPATGLAGLLFVSDSIRGH